jgi:Tripartite tricarboxylate transporter family receptor
MKRIENVSHLTWSPNCGPQIRPDPSGGRTVSAGPPPVSPSRRGRCRGADRVADRMGASVSHAASAHDRSVPGRRLDRHCRAPDGSVALRTTGNIGTEAVVRAPADGYTLLLATTTNVVNATVYDKLIFNFTRDIGSSCSAPRKWRINAKRAASRIATEHNAVPVWTSSHSPKPAGLRYQGLGVPNTSGPLRARTSIERQS